MTNFTDASQTEFAFAESVQLDHMDTLMYLKPNPFLKELCDVGSPVKQVANPYEHSIIAGKNTYVYDAHTYHTKVPPQGIQQLIEYYTRPGDVVLDMFCGSGMTGVAAAACDRRAVLSDLSPAAAFIAYNINTPVSASRYTEAVDRVLAESAEIERDLYRTKCRECGKYVSALYVVWSYGVICRFCEREFVLWDVARDEQPRVRDSKIKSEFDCPHCERTLKKRALKRTKRYPVAVGYKCCAGGLKEASHPPTGEDVLHTKHIEEQGVPAGLWYPENRFPDGLNTRQPIAAGIHSVDKAYTPRALYAMAHLWKLASDWPDPEVRLKLLFTLTSLYQRVTVFSEFRFWGGSGNTANYNVPAIMNEQNVFRAFARKANTIRLYFNEVEGRPRNVQVSTQSACRLSQLPDESVDYVFTDPPFGSNINYSEMNFLWESWLGVHTDTTEEAIVHPLQGKGLPEYQGLLTSAFSESRRVLKSGGWLTIVFHNSSEKVWAALQNAVVEAGFTIKGTQTFDKEHGTFKQFVSDNAVGYDLVLHCQKTQGDSAAAGDAVLRHDNDDDARQSAVKFAEERVNDAVLADNAYTVRYLHVDREEEFDYRKLYAEWLAEALPKTVVALSFSQFREVVRDVQSRAEQRSRRQR